MADAQTPSDVLARLYAPTMNAALTRYAQAPVASPVAPAPISPFHQDMSNLGGALAGAAQSAWSGIGRVANVPTQYFFGTPQSLAQAQGALSPAPTPVPATPVPAQAPSARSYMTPQDYQALTSLPTYRTPAIDASVTALDRKYPQLGASLASSPPTAALGTKTAPAPPAMGIKNVLPSAAASYGPGISPGTFFRSILGAHPTVRAAITAWPLAMGNNPRDQLMQDYVNQLNYARGQRIDPMVDQTTKDTLNSILAGLYPGGMLNNLIYNNMNSAAAAGPGLPMGQ